MFSFDGFSTLKPLDKDLLDDGRYVFGYVQHGPCRRCPVNVHFRLMAEERLHDPAAAALFPELLGH
ncbi:hypothetical protein ALISP_5052 [Alicycliphilus sp. B1]|nr:hypothetical protein ALISP_5052 [Alicycliphilus sp. B1]